MQLVSKNQNEVKIKINRTKSSWNNTRGWPWKYNKNTRIFLFEQTISSKQGNRIFIYKDILTDCKQGSSIEQQ